MSSLGDGSIRLKCKSAVYAVGMSAHGDAPMAIEVAWLFRTKALYTPERLESAVRLSNDDASFLIITRQGSRAWEHRVGRICCHARRLIL